ncbi:hypothetical protein Q1695_012449 [Nippostrongylus brasiliensis]|nr:hypothetical protein Q1695_012449 [Nippostrongylus brasiliensis]
MAFASELRNCFALLTVVLFIVYVLFVAYRLSLDLRHSQNRTVRDVVIPYLYNLERQKSVFSSKILSEKVPQNCSFCGSYKVAPQYRLATCKIEKSMSSISDAAICFLINTDAFIDNNKTISQERWCESLCENVNVAESLDSAIREADPNGNSTLFTVIRNPFYRFISGYIDKCQNERIWYSDEERCFGCRENLRCILESIPEALNSFLNKREITSATYYYLRHFAPQWWYCELHKNRNLYKVVKYQDGPDARQNFADAMEALLKSVGVPGNHRVVIYNEVMNGKMQHSTAGSSQRLAAEHELLSNDYLMWLLVKLYYNDFLLFYDID